MSDENDFSPSLDILIEEGYFPQEIRMVSVKRFPNGDVFADNSLGEMIIVRADGTVKTFLDDDTDWVTGRYSPGLSAWEIIGFHFGFTDGSSMDRTRNERRN